MTMTPSRKFELIHETLLADDNVLNISELCELAGVSRSGYYRWLNAEPVRIKRESQDRADFELILQAYRFRGYDKGIRGIHMRLLHMPQPIQMNVKKIQRLMRKYGLSCPIRKANPYRRMAKALKTNNVAGNLLNREFTAHGARSVLLTDITFIPYNGTFCYLSTILDAYTKQVLSYAVSSSLELDFVLECINLLVEKHGVSLNAKTLIHSDQGFHYTSYRFILSGCTAFEQVRTILDDWIDYYNNDRYQWQLAKLSPNEFYTYLTTGVYPLPGKPPVHDESLLTRSMVT